MKTLFKLTLAAVTLIVAVSAKADLVNGYIRSNGAYVAPYYRASSGSSYAGYSSSGNYGYGTPSVHVGGYTRNSGVYVMPYIRTSPNRTVTDNLGYRGY